MYKHTHVCNTHMSAQAHTRAMCLAEWRTQQNMGSEVKVLQVPLLTSFMNVGKSLGPPVHQILHLNKNNESYVVGLWQG